MTATPKKKGPTRTAIRSSHVTTSPLEGKAMNIATNTTAGRAAPIRHFSDLEIQISSLTSMTEITVNMLERTLTDVRALAGQRREPGDNWRIVMSDDQMRQLSFAWSDVAARVMKLEKDYFAILEGGEA